MVEFTGSSSIERKDYLRMFHALSDDEGGAWAAMAMGWINHDNIVRMPSVTNPFRDVLLKERIKRMNTRRDKKAWLPLSRYEEVEAYLRDHCRDDGFRWPVFVRGKDRLYILDGKDHPEIMTRFLWSAG